MTSVPNSKTGPESPTPDPSPGKSIVLVGLMGAGKSSVGLRLAGLLNRSFVDADHEIEKAAGCSVQDIFDLYGETAFRDCEKKVIARILDDPPVVLATGGGAFINPDIRAMIQAKAVSIWIRADLNTLVRRTARKGGRPLLKGKDPARALENLMAERNPVYTLANITVDTGDEPPESTARKAADALSRLAGAV